MSEETTELPQQEDRIGLIYKEAQQLLRKALETDRAGVSRILLHRTAVSNQFLRPDIPVLVVSTNDGTQPTLSGMGLINSILHACSYQSDLCLAVVPSSDQKSALDIAVCSRKELAKKKNANTRSNDKPEGADVPFRGSAGESSIDEGAEGSGDAGSGVVVQD